MMRATSCGWSNDGVPPPKKMVSAVIEESAAR